MDHPRDIRKFLYDLDTDEKYCLAKKPTPEPELFLLSKHLLPTTYLANDDELTRALRKYKSKYPDRADFIDLVIDKHFRPLNNQIPITSIDDNVTIEAISRIFSTLNSTGKMLSPFELVVSILYPNNIDLKEDIQTAKEAYPFYKRVDRDGDILLQTVALFQGKDTKKASLPKTIDASGYRSHFEAACKHLDEAAKLLTAQVGLGLDQSDELLVYPVIFPPMAFLLKEFSSKQMTHAQRAMMERKLKKWFVGAILSRRYQQSTHDKQQRDKTEIFNWIIGAEDDQPSWLSEAYIPSLQRNDPDSAVGKLIRALTNLSGIKDPLTNKPVGVGSGREQGQKHHIFPTKFVRHLDGWREGKPGDSNNVALNIMYVEQSTNASWLNADPAQQISECVKALGSENAVRNLYLAHGITTEAFNILKKPTKTAGDFYEFIQLREAYFVSRLQELGFRQASQPQESDEDIDLED